jgi:hypothetical protein
LFAQDDSVTVADYNRAEQMLYTNVSQKIDYASVRANWFDNDKFWYRVLTPTGSKYMLVDAAKGKRTEAFDHQKLASALSSATGKNYSADMLPFRSISYTDDGKSLVFTTGNKQWKADLKTYTITEDGVPQKMRDYNPNEVVSPDGTKAAFIKDYNLWVRDLTTNKVKQLTTDGIQYFGYATDNAGWKHSDAAILRWSNDSKKIATFQQDERKVGEMYLVSTKVGHPKLEQWKYPMPGDSNIIMIQRVIIDVDNPKVIRLQVAPDPHRGT